MGRFKAWRARGGTLPDAVVVIRGGGAVNDLAWLNDYDLARCLCELPVPVFIGIGHERDSTVLDEVAHTKFDTPSKVIAGIEQVIARRAADIRTNHDLIIRTAQQHLLRARRAVEQFDAVVRTASRQQLATARSAIPALAAQVQSEARRLVREARAGSKLELAAIRERVGSTASRARERHTTAMDSTARDAHRLVAEARSLAEAAASSAVLNIEFRDGRVAARTKPSATDQDRPT